MGAESVWRTWKPYVLIAVLAVAAIYWFTSQSSLASLKDGSYACTGVYVNESGKYEALTDETGRRLYAEATVENGKPVSLSSDVGVSMTKSEISELKMRTKGNSHFTVTDDHAVQMYDAVACDLED